ESDPEPEPIETRIEDDRPVEADLVNDVRGIDPGVLLNYNIQRIEEVSVPGPANLAEKIGIKGAEESLPVNVSPPPGLGGNEEQGGGLDVREPGNASPMGFAGGLQGDLVPGGFGGRSGATREQLVREGGGNAESEAAVAAGQKWLVQHQAPDGHWSLH